MKRTFTRNLIDWHYAYNKRIMPWKGVKDPYKIWLSEVILQQTRVAQGLSYYKAFIEHFPTIHKLAAANDEQVFKLWEGLGYYTRCKNLLHTARFIVLEKNGIFPKSYAEILGLKGIGPYTAAAISSFAYNLPNAVLDGNVFRLLSRYFGIAKPIDSTEGKIFFTSLAESLLHKEDSAGYNQAIMDFGAEICKPQIPLCAECVLRVDCIAYKNGLVNKLPIKSKKPLRKERWFYYFVFTIDDRLLIIKRTGRDIWQNLNEFYLIETDKIQTWNKVKIKKCLSEYGIFNFKIAHISPIYKQLLTHQTINGQFIHVELTSIPEALTHMQLIDIDNITSIPFPKFINLHLESYTLKNAE